MMFGGNSTPPVQPPAAPLPPPPNPPSFGANTRAAGDRAAQPGMGFGSTILTSGAGLTTPANTTRKTLLGQ